MPNHSQFCSPQLIGGLLTDTKVIDLCSGWSHLVAVSGEIFLEFRVTYNEDENIDKNGTKSSERSLFDLETKTSKLNADRVFGILIDSLNTR